MLPVDVVSKQVQPVGPYEICGRVYDRFTSDADLVAIAVVEKGKPIGILKRLDFLTRLADRYGRPLYEGKPVTYLMDANPVMVEETMSLDQLNNLLVADDCGALQSGFIVLENSFYKGIGTAATILQSNMMRTAERMHDLEKAQIEAEAANRAKTRFLANMSHELRTPLNAIIGFSEFLLSESQRGRPIKKIDGYIDDIRGSGIHLLGVINSILDMSKIESGKFTLVEDSIYADELVDQVLSMMEGMALTKQVKLNPVGFGSEYELHIDIQVIRQTLVNLLSNAIKFSPSGSEVCLTFHVHADKRFEICVCDNGPGLDEEAIEKVMEPFVQMESEYNRRHEGTGLGLPLVKAFTEAHGGVFLLTSKPGRGTTARVTLPASRLRQLPALRFAV